MQENITTVTEFQIIDTPKNSKKLFWLEIMRDGLGNAVSIPLMVVRGKADFPVLGVTAAVHGNELNGVQVIQRIYDNLDAEDFDGVIVGIPVVNIPAYKRKTRRFEDGTDLNHIMPGKADGNTSQIYAYRFIERVVKSFDYLLDLHTASPGRINTYYVRADMKHPTTRKLALLQNPQIIVHNPPFDGTLRGACHEMDIPAITMEIGNPNVYQRLLIRSGVEGVDNVMSFLEMTDDAIDKPTTEPVICKKSYWIYTDKGGLLTVYAELMQMLKKGEHIATLRDVFGREIKKYYAPEAGIVIGKSTSPVNQSGGRILHLGIVR